MIQTLLQLPIARIILLLFIAAPSFVLTAQPVSRYNTFSYSVNEGLLQTTIGEMELDGNNFCWLSFPNGIQKFDGKNFTSVPVQPGLPDDKFVNFFRCANGNLLISHARGISLYNIRTNRFRQVFASPDGEEGSSIFIGETDGIIYFYSALGIIRALHSETFAIVSSFKTGFPSYTSNANYYPKFSDVIIQHRTGILINSILYLWDLKGGKLLYQSETIPDISRFLLRLTSSKEVLFYTYNTLNTLKRYDFITKNTQKIILNIPANIYYTRCAIHSWKGKTIIALNERIYETDSSLQNLRSELVNFQNQPVSQGATITAIKEDDAGNLYIQTVTSGIKKVIRNNYPLKYYNHPEGGNKNIISVLPDKANNRILAGAIQNGLLVFDTLQRFVKQIKLPLDNGRSASPNCIVKTPDNRFVVFATSLRYCWLLNNDLSVNRRINFPPVQQPGKSGTQYFGNPLYQNEKEALIQTQDRFYKYNFLNNTVSEHQVADGYVMSGLYHNGHILIHVNDELVFLEPNKFGIIRKIPFKNTGYVRCYATDRNNNIYIGSNKGIFKIDGEGKILSHYNKDTGLPDECIYAMTLDEDDQLWCSSNKGIFPIRNNKVFMQLKREDGLQENEFNTNCVARAPDGELFFGGVNGISSFFPSRISTIEEKLSLVFTKIRANNEDLQKDTAAWNINSISLPYNQNALSFDFITTGDHNPDQYIYQYRMVGLEKEWIQSNNLQTVRYVLPTGHYTFQVYASRSFQEVEKPLKEIKITIRPPFWKTWWFRVLAASALLGFVVVLVNEKTKRKFAHQLQVLENERQLKMERERISRDLHDSLGAYANAVLYNTELLEKEKGEEKRKELIGDLKFASKDIITSLRETVWALKKESYTAEECFVRIRNFIQPLSRYYAAIHFTIEGDAPATLLLPHTKALNLVRIVQEAVTNSIKHATPSHIKISSSMDNGHWYLVVKDDGCGFIVSANKQDAGNGLGNMQQRAADSGFDYSLLSNINTGTQITMIIKS